MEEAISPRVPRGNKKNRTALMISIIVFLLVAVVAIFIFRQPKEAEKAPAVTVTEIQEKEPTPTEEPEIDKESVKIQVINGTGTPGDARKAVEALKTEGYSADNIKTGNAEEFDTTDTTITAKDGFESIASNIEEVLKDTFDDIEIKSSNLEKDNEFDIVIVTGGEKYAAATPTKSASTGTTPNPTSSVSVTPSPTLTLTPTPKP